MNNVSFGCRMTKWNTEKCDFYLSSQCWKNGVKKMSVKDDLEEKEGVKPCKYHAQGGLVPTERAQWVSEAEACWIYKQSIYPATDPERLAAAMVIYTDTWLSFTDYSLYSIYLPLPPSLPFLSLAFGPWGPCLSGGTWCPVSLQLWSLIIVTTDSVSSISFLFGCIINKAAVA